MRKFAEYLSLQLVVSIVQILSIDACAQLCRWLAWLFADVIKFRRSVIDENILGVYPDMPEPEPVSYTHLTLPTKA